MKYPANVFSEKTEFFSRDVLKPANKKKQIFLLLPFSSQTLVLSSPFFNFFHNTYSIFFSVSKFRSRKKTGLKRFSPVMYLLSNEELFFLPNAARADAGTQAEATTDFTFYNQSEDVIQRLMQGVEIVTDTQHVAGSASYEWLRELYRSSKAAAENQVPGADTVVDDLKSLFEGQGNPGIPPPPVV